ncbi:histone acetyltransferase ESA1 [Ascosphaera apis ARSEF 7405]|uniref:Histone acetyltransferase ESA1 n=1 Tax=Ascosphaera apis ARSEF 7405 TaxID=392613 RepID=A0A167YER5_9EURO|nr:histone acetyltransferase ESA1 [Ascosphaera apis ARSEF 7405]
MVARDASKEASGSPDPVDKGYATLATLRIGVKAWVKKNDELRRAEILSIRQRKDGLSFYVHYVDFNKRLDEWVSADRIDLSKEVEWPQPEKADKKKAGGAAGNKNKRARAESSDLQAARGQNVNRRPSKTTTAAAAAAAAAAAGGKENDAASILGSSAVSTPAVEKDMPMPDADESTVQKKIDKEEGFTATDRKEEIEKLRVGGSMTQNPTEVHRVRNLNKVLMGKYEIEPWYFSPYPASFSDAEVVYIDEFCLSYFDDYKQFERHRSKCTLMHPPGNEIYRDDNVSFFEVDGRRQRTWCRNLCLLSKLFLDHKTLYYDVDPFLFYCMCSRDEHGCHLLGYFSKEKESAEGYNVACILTLPQYQRKGYGRLLIAFSYELSKREGKLGSPEKPLSDLGLVSYRQYWTETLVELLVEPGRETISESELASLSAMTEKDVHETLVVLNLLRYNRGNWIIILTDAIVEQYQKRVEKEKIRGARRIDPTKLQWKPPVFSAASRTWNW